MDDDNRNSFAGTTRIVIGTDCFTWGVDVPDIRNVVVFGLPSSFSKLVQQIGRAGRDGNQAYATTYAPQWVKDVPEGLQKHTKLDIANLKRREEMCPVLHHWFNTSPESCSRTVFCVHFGEPPSQPNNCCLHHYKTLPNMEPEKERMEEFSTAHPQTSKVRSDGTYRSFKEKRLTFLRDSASRMIARWTRQAWEDFRGENTLFPSTAFFPDALQKKLSENIHMVTTIDKLSGLLKDWHYLDSHGDKLFKFCEEVVKSLDDIRQGLDDESEDEEEDKATVSIKIKIPPPKQKVHNEELTGERPPKRQCRGNRG